MGGRVRYLAMAGIAVAIFLFVWLFWDPGPEVVPDVAAPEWVSESAEPEPYVARRGELPFVLPDRGEREAPAEAAEPKPLETGDGRISGRGVTAEAERPATLTIDLYHITWGRLDEPKEEGLRASIATGPDGAFDFPDLPLGHYFVHVYAPDVIGTALLELTRAAPVWEEPIPLYVSGPIAGVVLDPAGQPVSGALVYLHSRRHEGTVFPVAPAGSLYFRATTGDDGRFRLDEGQVRPRPREYKLVAAAEGYALAISDWVSPRDMNVVFRLEYGSTASGVAVFADSGKPAAGIELITFPTAQLHRSQVITADDGSFTFQGMGAGQYRVDAIDDVYITDAASATFEISGRGPTSGLRVELVPGGIVSGFVTDADTGEGIAGVTLVSTGQRPKDVFVDVEVKTTVDGYYAIKGLASDEYDISVRSVEGYGWKSSSENNLQRVSVLAPGEVPNVDFQFSKGLQVRGQVVDKSGAPVAHANVSANSQSQGTRSSGYAVANNRGLFEIAGLLPDTTYRVSAYKTGFARSYDVVEIADESVTDLRVTLLPGASIKGKVVDLAGRPVSKVQVEARDPELELFARGIAPTGEDGGFEIQNLAPGTYHFEIEGRGASGELDRSPVGLSEGEIVTGVRLVFDPADEFELTGRVRTGSGQPIVGALVSRMDNDSIASSTDASGRFELDVPEGEYGLTVQHREYSTVMLQEIASGTRSLDIRMRGRGRIEGRVIDARTRGPLSQVSVRDQPDVSAGYFDERSAQRTNDEGRFRIENAQEGAHSLIATAAGYAMAVHRVEGVEENETIRGITIALEREAILEGVVTNPSGRPVAGAQVVYQTDVNSDRVTTGDDGRFRMAAVPPGELTVTAYHEEFVSGSINVNLESNRVSEVEIRLTGGGTVQGYVTFEGEPASGERVNVVSANMNVSFDAGAITDENGFYSLDGVPVGEIVVNAWTDKLRRLQSRRLQLDGSRTVSADFHFVLAAGTIEGTVHRDDGEPVEGSVEAQLEFPDGRTELAGTQIESDGSYQIGNAPVGTLTITFRFNDGSGRLHGGVYVEAGETVVLDYFPER